MRSKNATSVLRPGLPPSSDYLHGSRLSRSLPVEISEKFSNSPGESTLTGWSSARSVIKSRALGKMFQVKEQAGGDRRRVVDKSAGFRFFKVGSLLAIQWRVLVDK